MACFIASQRDGHGFPQAVSCRALGVSQSWFYKWKDGELKAEIARLFAEREGKDGSPRITAALRDAGWRVSENAETPGRLFCLCYWHGKGNAQVIPGWPHSRLATLEPGRTSWTLPLNAVHLGPEDDTTEVTVPLVRTVLSGIWELAQFRESPGSGHP